MANNATIEQINVLERLYAINGLHAAFSLNETEWGAIVRLQNTLDNATCHKYIFNLDKLGVTLVTATIDQRIQALITAKQKL